MSADNGIMVREFSNEPEMFGIFYWSGDGIPEDGYTLARAEKSKGYKDAAVAVLIAHLIEADHQTEYGVSCSLKAIEGLRQNLKEMVCK